MRRFNDTVEVPEFIRRQIPTVKANCIYCLRGHGDIYRPLYVLRRGPQRVTIYLR